MGNCSVEPAERRGASPDEAAMGLDSGGTSSSLGGRQLVGMTVSSPHGQTVGLDGVPVVNFWAKAALVAHPRSTETANVSFHFLSIS
jgi:hypothetical protein